MLNEINQKTKLDILITLIATITSVFFIILSYLWANYAIQILSILIIILPTIYIIGNLIIRGLLDKEYEDAVRGINEGIEEMEDEIETLKEENMKLRQDKN